MIKKWMEDISKYPPNEIYYQTAGGKKELNSQNACHELFKYNPGTHNKALSDVRSAWIELSVTLNLSKLYPVKQEYIKKVLIDFVAKAKIAIDAMELIFKKNQDVWAYYQTWKLSKKQFDEEIKKMNIFGDKND